MTQERKEPDRDPDYGLCDAPEPIERTLDERLIGIIGDIYDLREDVLFGREGVQPEFDAGMLAAAGAILDAMVDDDAALDAERNRQCEQRLKRWPIRSTNTPESQP